MGKRRACLAVHPLLEDPASVLVLRFRVTKEPSWEEFRSSAAAALAAAEVRLLAPKAVLKPNFTSGEHLADPESGIQTHPAFIWGMIEYLREHGAPRGGVYVLEDPRDTNDNEPRHWRGTGMPEVAAKIEVKLRCPTSYTCTTRTVPRPLVHSTRKVSRLAVDPGAALINVPKLKTHNLTVTTLCMKNLMGVVNVWDRHYCSQAFAELPGGVGDGVRRTWEGLELSHRALGRRLADLARVVRPDLNVVEGIVGRDGSGFQRGRNYPTGLVVMGANVVAVDAVACYLMGFDPAKILYLQVASEAGLGPADLRGIRVLEASEGAIRVCRDPEALAARRPFRVFTGVKGYQEAVRRRSRRKRGRRRRSRDG